MEKEFKISNIGDTKARTTLGPTTSVEIFRIEKAALTNIVTTLLDEEKSSEVIYMSGKAIGGEIFKTFLASVKSLDELVPKFRQLLIDLKIGVASVVSADLEKGKLVIRVDECVSCSGTPNIGKPVCYFEGGVIAGVLKGFLKKEITVKEVKCWGLGDNFCEFNIDIL